MATLIDKQIEILKSKEEKLNKLKEKLQTSIRSLQDVKHINKSVEELEKLRSDLFESFAIRIDITDKVSQKKLTKVYESRRELNQLFYDFDELYKIDQAKRLYYNIEELPAPLPVKAKKTAKKV